MDKIITIALDAMGGDYAPAIVVKSINLIAPVFPNARFILYGNQSLLNPLVDSYASLAENTRIVHTDQIIAPTLKPSTAIRQYKSASMRLAIEAVATGEAHAVVSAGNTGAYMALAKLILKTLPGVDRPAIASVMPSKDKRVVMLDLGANIECKAEHLVQFAIMGEAFARCVLNLSHPVVGLLNIGSEDLKGNDSIKLAAQLLRDHKIVHSFYGFVEGDGIFKGDVDVVVADGFSGNIALKTIEGTAKFIRYGLEEAFHSSWMARLAYLFAYSALKKFKMKFDPRRHNGGIFLGLQGIAIKSHGGADEVAFAEAINTAILSVRHGINERIKTELAQLPTVLTLPTSEKILLEQGESL